MSANLCGCDPEAHHVCEQHTSRFEYEYLARHAKQEPAPRGLPTDDKSRKALPIFDGLLMYFPDACLAVAEVSRVGNEQHNPGEPLHWARGKSMDQMNTAVRHQMDHGMGRKRDTDGTWHLAKAAWRNLAALQLAIEAERAGS